ncbi:hypothetical protein [Rhodoligotrophos defluvii]|uniref:hypothetical protein n=1 Tax=Rhodoligotrophos defluvii TaxID=2561934 RepID=UPI0010C9F145|nr:hypothetical protein [Rhodoligotrophos defluvii]
MPVAPDLAIHHLPDLLNNSTAVLMNGHEALPATKCSRSQTQSLLAAIDEVAYDITEQGEQQDGERCVAKATVISALKT